MEDPIVLSFGQHAWYDSAACLVEAADAVRSGSHYGTPFSKTSEPKWLRSAPCLRMFAVAANDAYGFDRGSDERRTRALIWAVDALPKADLSREAELKRLYSCATWAIADAAEFLDRREMRHSLWRLDIPHDEATVRLAKRALREIDRGSISTVTWAHDCMCAALDTNACWDAVLDSMMANRAANVYYVVSDMSDENIANGRMVDTTHFERNANEAYWRYLDAKIPARLRVLCEMRA